MTTSPLPHPMAISLSTLSEDRQVGLPGREWHNACIIIQKGTGQLCGIIIVTTVYIIQPSFMQLYTLKCSCINLGHITDISVGSKLQGFQMAYSLPYNIELIVINVLLLLFCFPAQNGIDLDSSASITEFGSRVLYAEFYVSMQSSLCTSNSMHMINHSLQWCNYHRSR